MSSQIVKMFIIVIDEWICIIIEAQLDAIQFASINNNFRTEKGNVHQASLRGKYVYIHDYCCFLDFEKVYDKINNTNFNKADRIRNQKLRMPTNVHTKQMLIVKLKKKWLKEFDIERGG